MKFKKIGNLSSSLNEFNSRAELMNIVNSESEIDLFNKLPKTFSTKEFLQIAIDELEFTERTAARKLRTWTKLKLVKKESFGKYLKI